MKHGDVIEVKGKKVSGKFRCHGENQVRYRLKFDN